MVKYFFKWTLLRLACHIMWRVFKLQKKYGISLSISDHSLFQQQQSNMFPHCINQHQNIVWETSFLDFSKSHLNSWNSSGSSTKLPEPWSVQWMIQTFHIPIRLFFTTWLSITDKTLWYCPKCSYWNCPKCSYYNCQYTFSDVVT